jgi:uncharacterized protein YycO
MFKNPPAGPVHKPLIQKFAPGLTVANPTPGDFLLTHGNSWTSKLIRFGQMLRYTGAERVYTRWNHAALFVSENGDIVEALGGGVQKRNVAVYKDTEYHVVRLQNVVDVNRRHEVAFAMACLNDSYGFFTILSIALSLLSGSKFGFGVDGQEICSALVARCLERTGEIFQQDPWHMTPADLAKYYDVRSADLSAPTGIIPSPDSGVQQRST